MEYTFFNRDKSWLSFNDRLLDEAQRENVPLMERIKFLSIYSSNLDEFYRVRMPALMVLNKVAHRERTEQDKDVLVAVSTIINTQQEKFGNILQNKIIPLLRKSKIRLLYNQPIPESLQDDVTDYFYNEVASFIRVSDLDGSLSFFPENNKLYLLVIIKTPGSTYKQFVVNIPSDHISRFYAITQRDIHYLIFLDDIVKSNVSKLFDGDKIISCHSFKITRDGELDIKDEFQGNLAKKIEKQLSKRDLGLATRFLYEGKIEKNTLKSVKQRLGLKRANMVSGGAYHNLKDLVSVPLKDKSFFYKKWPQTKVKNNLKQSAFAAMRLGDFLLHPPFHSYDLVLRFFNEASIDKYVTVIYTTIYRIASNSRIAHALINAARNGKRVIVFVELKARFDEENNIKWAKKMKEAGVQIIYSIPSLKVHSKVALVKRKAENKTEYLGILATGNFNENTAKFYTDHLLFTSDTPLLKEVETLFKFLKKRRKPLSTHELSFKHLLVGQFNLQQSFLNLISREIENARNGFSGSIIIKVNNLEDNVLISKLYEASQAGVKISLIIRGICCLVPGVKGMSENITVRRIVDRYLEHGRVFIFSNKGDLQVYLGSADWMNRNIYRRIEICFSVTDEKLKNEILQIINFQLADNVQAVEIDSDGSNIPIVHADTTKVVRSQEAISYLLSNKHSNRSESKESFAIPAVKEGT